MHRVGRSGKELIRRGDGEILLDCCCRTTTVVRLGMTKSTMSVDAWRTGIDGSDEAGRDGTLRRKSVDSVFDD